MIRTHNVYFTPSDCVFPQDNSPTLDLGGLLPTKYVLLTATQNKTAEHTAQTCE